MKQKNFPLKKNNVMSKKHKTVCEALNYIELLLVFASAVTGYVSISSFTSLVGIPMGITNSAVELKFFVLTAGIKKYKSIIKKKKNYDEIVLLAKTKLNSIEVLI